MTDKEVMQMALDALELWQKTCLDCGRSSDELGRATKPLQALRTALEQPEPERYTTDAMKVRQAVSEAVLQQSEQGPIAYLCENAVGHKYFRWKKPPSTYKPIALYTEHASPQRIWQGLTDEEVVDRANAEVFAEAFARGVAWAELKLKEKNNG